MKAAVVREIGRVEIEEIPEPVPSPYQAVAEVLCWATCNSTDLSAVKGTIPWMPPLPMILGHETVGRVVSVGSKVRNYKEGDIRLRITAVYPRETMGEFHSGLGSFTSVGLATDVEAMKADGLDTSGLVITHFLHQAVPPDMAPADAAMIINLREALSWVKALDVEGKNVLIIGDGPVGLGFAQMAGIRGAQKVTLVGHRDSRLELGRQFGAHHTINSRQEDPLERIQEFVGSPAIDVLIDCVGDRRALAESLVLVRPDGKVAGYGVPKPSTGPPVDDPRIVKVSTDEPGAHDEVVRLIQEGRINPRDHYTERLHFSKIGEAIDLIAKKKALMKVVLEPED
jgi:L-iditol 2-dehydrogenase